MSFVEVPTITYKVKFFKTGYDHYAPYCSGEEADDDNIIESYVVLTIKKYERVKSLNDLDFTHESCTSGGSKYCYGFYQKYKAIKIISVEDGEDEDGEDEDEKDDDEDDEDDEKDDDDDEEYLRLPLQKYVKKYLRYRVDEVDEVDEEGTS